MKNTIRILGIAIILVLLAQIVLTFMPYFDFADMVKPDRKGNIPESEFSLQEYCWMDTEDMGKNFFKTLIEEYDVNANAVPLVLAFVIGCVVIVLNAMNFGNSFNTYVTFRAGFVKVLAHLFSIFWAYLGIDAYLNVGVLQFGDQQLYMIHLILVYVTSALIGLRLVLELVHSISEGNKARAARRAAREAA